MLREPLDFGLVGGVAALVVDAVERRWLACGVAVGLNATLGVAVRAGRREWYGRSRTRLGGGGTEVSKETLRRTTRRGCLRGGGSGWFVGVRTTLVAQFPDGREDVCAGAAERLVDLVGGVLGMVS